MTQSSLPYVKGEKPHVYTIPYNVTPAWTLAWQAAGFEAIRTLPKPDKAHVFEAYFKRIQSRPNAPTIDGYARWIYAAVSAKDSQYVFMVQPWIFPGPNIKLGVVTEAVARYVTKESLVLLRGAEAIIGTRNAFFRMADLLASDHGVTAENATDGFIVRRVQERFPDFVIDVPCAKGLIASKGSGIPDEYARNYEGRWLQEAKL